MGEQRRVICPVCWHEETMRARRLEQEPCRDDVIMMHWRPPYRGPRGPQLQMGWKWDMGGWECLDGCGLRVTAHEAGVLLSAALTASDPDCDSIDEDGVHADALIAWKGGDNR